MYSSNPGIALINLVSCIALIQSDTALVVDRLKLRLSTIRVQVPPVAGEKVKFSLKREIVVLGLRGPDSTSIKLLILGAR